MKIIEDYDPKYIQYIQILTDDAYFYNFNYDIVHLKKGDIISIQFSNIKKMIVKLNDVKISENSLQLFYEEHNAITWSNIYYEFSLCSGLVYNYITEQMIRDNKINKLLNETKY